MSDKYSIAIVEDSKPQRMLLVSLLSKDYDVVEFSSGEDFIQASPSVDTILLDIEMPGINGYETCRQMRTQDQYNDTPVIFVSAHDTPEDRVEAYEAGGDHFLTKPIVANELKHKVESVLNHRNALLSLKSQSSMAQQMAFAAMAGMGDLGVIIDFQRKSATCKNYDELSQFAIDAISAWGLRGMVQVRGSTGIVNMSSDSAISPLQASVMETMRNMGRIFELKSRAVVNFQHVSILVHNLPTEEPDKVGRLRDNLTLLGEAADICIANMDTSNVRKRQITYLGDAVAELTKLMQKAAVRDSQNRNAIQRQTMEVLDGLAHSFSNLGLTGIQQEYIGNLVHDGIDELTNAFDEASTIQRDFTDILVRLQTLAENAPKPESLK